MNINGPADEGFGAVADQFRRNLDSGRELGAAVSAYVGGRAVVDLWAGTRDRATGAPWTADTLNLIFSVTKSLMTIAALRLSEEGRLDLDVPIATYWPEFAAHGKDRVTTRWALSHRAGLPFLDAKFTLADLSAWTPVIHALEDQEPNWAPGTGYAYHGITFGHLVGEVVRRITGQTPGTYFREQFAAPSDLDIWIGLPPSERGRLAQTETAPHEWTDPEILAKLILLSRTDDRQLRSVMLDGAVQVPVPGITAGSDWNDADMLHAEIPGVNGCATARSLAKIFAATVGEVDGVRILGPHTIADAVALQSTGDPVFGTANPRARIGTGFFLGSPVLPMLGPHSFGHAGAGGQLAFADPDQGVGFGFVTNQMGGIPDSRASGLAVALRDCLQ